MNDIMNKSFVEITNIPSEKNDHTKTCKIKVYTNQILHVSKFQKIMNKLEIKTTFIKRLTFSHCDSSRIARNIAIFGFRDTNIAFSSHYKGWEYK